MDELAKIGTPPEQAPSMLHSAELQGLVPVQSTQPMAEFIGERIGRNRRGEVILSRRTAGSAHSASPRWKTRLSNALSSRC